MATTTLRPIIGPARALYCAFNSKPNLPRLHASARPSNQCIEPQRRYINRYATGQTAAPITPFNDPHRPLDEAIKSDRVYFVDDSENLHPGFSLRKLLSQLDRKKEHIQQVSLHEDEVPIVKIRTKRWLRETEELRVAQKKAQASTTRSSKELELSWGIDQNNDLEHRLKKMEEWLEEGRQVEILIGQKRGGKKIGDDDMEDLVRLVQRRAMDVKGTHEQKAMQGKIGGNVVLTFKGSEAGGSGLNVTQTMRKERQEKMKKKEEEKQKKREQAEEKKRRAIEREKEKLDRLKSS